MKYTIEINLSTQARNLLDNMPKINEKDLIEWFTKVRKINVGGGDVIDYINYLKSQGK